MIFENSLPFIFLPPRLQKGTVKETIKGVDLPKIMKTLENI